MFFVDFLLHKLFVYKYLPCFVQRSFNDFKQLELFVVAATASATVAVVVSVSGWCFLNIFPCLPWLIVMQFVCIVHDKQKGEPMQRHQVEPVSPQQQQQQRQRRQSLSCGVLCGRCCDSCSNKQKAAAAATAMTTMTTATATVLKLC